MLCVWSLKSSLLTDHCSLGTNRPSSSPAGSYSPSRSPRSSPAPSRSSRIAGRCGRRWPPPASGSASGRGHSTDCARDRAPVRSAVSSLRKSPPAAHSPARGRAGAAAAVRMSGPADRAGGCHASASGSRADTDSPVGSPAAFRAPRSPLAP